ncbi:F-box protein, partial [Melia azedarach]
MDNIDRISDLPHLILHHIMSFLSFKQVIQTSLLSKQWQRAWHSFPILEFDRAVFPPNLRFYRHRVIDIDEDTVIEEGEAEGKEKLFKLLSYMEETLHNRHRQMISVKKFTLQLFESRLKVAE